MNKSSLPIPGSAPKKYPEKKPSVPIPGFAPKEPMERNEAERKLREKIIALLKERSTLGGLQQGHSVSSEETLVLERLRDTDCIVNKYKNEVDNRKDFDRLFDQYIDGKISLDRIRDTFINVDNFKQKYGFSTSVMSIMQFELSEPSAGWLRTIPSNGFDWNRKIR